MQDALLVSGDRNLVLQAGAGTGKTHALLTIALQLLAGVGGRRVPPARLVLLTFTEKAALQLRERLQRRVAALCESPTCEPGLVADRDVWLEIRRDLHECVVATFHAFCAAQLRRFSREAEIDPGFDVLDDADARLLHAEAARAEVLDLLDADDADARSLVEQFGLGGGGTPGLVELLRAVAERMTEDGRSSRSLDDGRWDDERWRPQLDAAQAQVRSAWTQLRARPPRAVLPHLDALDALLSRLDAVSPDELHDESKALRRMITGGRGEPLLAMVDEALAALELALGARDGAPLGRAFAALLGRVEERFARRKAARRVLDFADLQRHLRLLLLRDVGVRRALKAQFDVLLVDELQDTNRVQQDLVMLLGEERGHETALASDRPLPPLPWAPGRTIVVGDRKQSIYAFRGAELSGVQRLEQALVQQGDARLVQLRRSYRARPAIVALTNALAERIFTEEAERAGLEAMREEAPSPWHVELLTAAGPDAAGQRADEARRIAARISNLLWNEADPVRVQAPDGSWRRARPRDVVILLRRLTAVDLYRQALAAQAIPHAVVGGGSFFERLEVIDAWALLATVADPTDAFASAALLRSPWCALSDATLTLLSLSGADGRTRPRGLALARLASERPRVADAAEAARLEALLDFVARMSPALDRLGSAEVLATALEQLDYLAVAAVSPDADAVAANLGKLEELLRRWERDGSPREAVRQLGERLRHVPREPEALPFDEEAPTGVRLMTVHQAKGLEFPVVFVADCGAMEPRDADRIAYDPELGLGLSVRRDDDTLVPDLSLERIRHQRRERARAESLRLLYVAATRARDHLVFSGAPRTGSWMEVLARLPETLLHRSETLAPVPAPKLAEVPSAQVVSSIATTARVKLTLSLDELIARALETPLRTPNEIQLFPWTIEIALAEGSLVVHGAVESVQRADAEAVEVVARMPSEESTEARAWRVRTIGLAERALVSGHPKVRVVVDDRAHELSNDELDAHAVALRKIAEKLLRAR